MKKYVYIFKTTLMESLQYVSNILLGFLSYALMIFIFLNLWNYMYQDSSNIIQGYTLNQMMWYVIITEMIWSGTRNKSLTNEISLEIKSGKIAYNINKPYHYVFYLIAKYLGDIIIKYICYIFIAISLGFLFVGPLESFQIENLVFVIIPFLLGIFINILLTILISLTSFWVEESKPFHWIYDKLILVFGTIFPVEVFPLWLQPIIRYTPIFVVTYGPARLVIQFSTNLFYRVLLTQFVYLIIGMIFVLIIYKKGVKKVNVNGG